MPSLPDSAWLAAMEHHVYFWLKPEHLNEADRAAFEAGLDSLFTIPGCIGGFWGRPAPVMPRPVIDSTWHYGTSMHFPDVETQDVYQVHETHEAFIGNFSSWWEKVEVRDLAKG
ncbi:Dabb family protein [Haloferula sargassicola]